MVAEEKSQKYPTMPEVRILKEEKTTRENNNIKALYINFLFFFFLPVC